MSQKREIAVRIADLLLTHGETSRGAILEEFSVRPAALYETIADLTTRGLVHEPLRKGRNTGSRPSPIVFDPAFGLFVGIELGVADVTAVCIDVQGTVLDHRRALLPADTGIDDAKACVGNLLEQIRHALGDDRRRLRAVGFADPGLVDALRGMSIKAVHIRGWENVPAAEWIGQLTGAPAQVLPAPMARAYAEATMAKTFATKGIFHLQLDKGIGGGFVRNGRLFFGDTGCAMEVGHIVVQEGGPICQCGNRGCLEAVAGLGGLERYVRELTAHGVNSPLAGQPFSLPHFLACLEAGDKAAFGIAEVVGQAIGQALSSLVCILNPSRLVFSGSLARMGPPLLQTVRRVLSLRCLPQAIANLELQISHLGSTGTALGAALLARRAATRAFARRQEILPDVLIADLQTSAEQGG